MKYLRRRALLVCLSLAAAPWVNAQSSLALSSGNGAPNQTTALTLTLTSPPNSEPSAIQWTLSYSANDITAISVTATDSNKTAVCTPATGAYSCILYGEQNNSPIPNGVVAVVSVMLSASPANPVPIGVTGTLAASPAGTPVALGSSGGTITFSSANLPTSVDCAPNVLTDNTSSTCFVTLSQPAPVGGAQVSLTSYNPLLQVPGSVTVLAGDSAATFTAVAGQIATDQTAVITAGYNGGLQAATLSLARPAVVSGLSCVPAVLGMNSVATCTVSISVAAPAGGAMISLASNVSSLVIPSTVTIAPGAKATTFPAVTSWLPAVQSAILTATYLGNSRSATLTLEPDVIVSGLACSPSVLGPGGDTTCTVSLAEIAPAGGTAITLSSSNAALSLPPSVVVAAGKASATFIVTTANVANDLVASVTASAGGSWASVAITIQSAALKSFTCNPATIGTAATSTCTITVSEPVSAPAGLAVSILSSSSILKSPASVTVPMLYTSVSFAVTPGTITFNQTVVLTAVLNGQILTTSVSLATGPAVSSLSCSPVSLPSASSGSCTLSLSGAAPAGGLSVDLSSNNSGLSVPTSVNVATGTRAATFPVTAGTIDVQTTAVVTATLNGIQSATLTLLADPPPPVYYFPHLALGAGFQTVLTFVNYSNQTVSCQTSFFSDSGAPLLVSFGGTPAARRTDVLAPGTSIHQQTQTDPASAPASGWAQAQCSGPVKASATFRLYNQGSAVGEAGVNATSTPTTKFATFAETRTGIAYANPSTQPAVLTMTAVDGTGRAVGSQTVNLTAGGHGFANAGPLFNLTSFSGSVLISSTAPIVFLAINAEAFPVFSSLPAADLDPSTALWTGSGALPPVAQTFSYNYYFPHLAFGGGFQTILTYVNYSPRNVSCQTSFFSDSGAPLPVPFGAAPAASRLDALAPGASIHQQTVADLNGAAVSGWAQAQCTGPIKASVLFRLYAQGVAAGEASVSAASLPAATFVTFAETHTGVAYANPSATQPATLTVTAVDGVTGRALAAKSITLDPGAHAYANVGPLLGLNSFSGFVEITATAPVVSLSLNAEAFPVFSSLPPGDADPSVTLAVP